jgi:nucleotide-binding universal stress UspA family protein
MENTRNTTTFLVCISDQHESEVALRFACLRAQKRNAQVTLLHVIPPEDFQGLFAISDMMKQEREEEAQNLLNSMAELALQCSGIRPSIVLREGILGEEIVKTTLENGDIVAVVLGVQHDSPTAPKLLSWLTSKLGQELLTPIMVVPGNLTDAQIDALV